MKLTKNAITYSLGIIMGLFLSGLAQAQSVDQSSYLQAAAQQQTALKLKEQSLWSTAQAQANTGSAQSLLTPVPIVPSVKNLYKPPYLDPIYTEYMPESSGLFFNPDSDTQESFTAPNGKTVTVLVKGPEMIDAASTYNAPLMSSLPSPNNIPDNYFPYVVNEAINRGAHRLVIPEGTYNFQGPTMIEGDKAITSQCGGSGQPACSCAVQQYWYCSAHWQIGSYNGPVIQDLEIDGSGSTLNFPAPTTGIWIMNTQRVRLKNFVIDYRPLPVAALGTIVADPLNKGHNGLVIDNDYPVSDMNKAYTFNGYPQVQAVDAWDGGNAASNPGHFDAGANNSGEVYFLWAPANQQATYVVGGTSAGAQTYTCKNCGFATPANKSYCNFFNGCANFDGFSRGTRVVVRYFTYNGMAVSINWSDDIDLENITLFSSPGNGIGVDSYSHRGFRLANSTITRADPYRLVSVASGSVDIHETGGDSIIENNTIAYQGDDGLAFSPALYQLAYVDVTDMQLDVPPVCSGICGNPKSQAYPMANDYLGFFDQNQDYLGSAQIKTISTALNKNGTWISTMGLQNCSPMDCKTLLVRLESSWNHQTRQYNDQYTDFTRVTTPRYIVQNNQFYNNRGHAIITDSSFGLINDNTAYNNTSGNIWLENLLGPGANNLTISQNKLASPGQSLGNIFAMAQNQDGSLNTNPIFNKIVISGNTIDAASAPAITAFSMHDFYVDSNLISGTDECHEAWCQGDLFGILPFSDSMIVYAANTGNVCGTEFTEDSIHGPIGIDPSATSDVIDPSSC